jgi:hypothetical protein
LGGGGFSVVLLFVVRFFYFFFREREMKTRLWRKERERGENVFCFGAFVVLFR